MSWWQKKLLRYGLRYGLSRTGLLNDEALDLDNLEITIGSKNVIELKDVSLNIERISKLAQLPPSLRLETARIVLLRLTIPADFYQSSISAEVDGVEIVSRFVEEEHGAQQRHKARPASPTNIRTPQHRKSNRRLHSPPPLTRDISLGLDENVHIPTTQEVAKSFLRDEPLMERKELEASVSMNPSADAMEDSLVSDGSNESGDLGTGMAVGLPGFLASFLQGLVDRFIVTVKNVDIRLEAELGTHPQHRVPITLRFRVASAHVDKLDQARGDGASDAPLRRAVKIGEISLDLITDALASDQPDFDGKSSFGDSKVPSDSSHRSKHSYQPSETFSSRSTDLQNITELQKSSISDSQTAVARIDLPTESYMFNSDVTRRDDNVEDDLPLDDVPQPTTDVASELDIQLGDDNISWGSRRSQSNALAEDLWSSMASEDDLPDSLLIEPDRGSTPRAQSSREGSPSSVRSRRPVSPYDRVFRGPGSWPTLDDGPPQPRSQSIRSWPTLNQSQHSAFEPLAHILESSSRRNTDNKMNALEINPPPEQNDELASSSYSSQEEDMLQSRFFSHEEAQSMYLSAMTSGPGVNSPGQLAPDAQIDTSSSGSSDVQYSEHALAEEDIPIEDDLDQVARDPSSGNVTPRAQTPTLEPTQEAKVTSPDRVVKQIIYVNSLTIFLPTDGEGDTSENSAPTPLQRSTHQTRGIPGTFSAYSDMSSSRKGLISSTTEDQRTRSLSRDNLNTSTDAAPIGLEVGSIRLVIDISSMGLLYKVTRKITSNLDNRDRQTKSTKPTDNAPSRDLSSFGVSIAELSLLVMHDTEYKAPFDTSIARRKNEIFGLHINKLSHTHCSTTEVRLQTLGISVCGTELLAVDTEEDSSMSSRVLQKDDTSVAVRMSSDKFIATRRPVTEVTIETSPIKLLLDTTVIEDALESLGGFEGIIELSNSITSESGTESSSSNARAARGVHFATDFKDETSSPELKLNARIGGIVGTLQGSQCSVVLRTSTLKAVYRELGAVATVDHISLKGPYDERKADDCPISIDLANLRTEYLVTPQDKDLERLLSLLTPSKDKYENDDDILIDTLLRQRRKGALLRLSLGQLRFKLDDWNCSSSLMALTDELTKLSAVTKYLPEDERPGLLTLCRIKEIDTQVPVNKVFGIIRTTVHDVHLAHVGLPALLAFSISAVGVRKKDDTILIHDLLPPSSAENLPMIMARMLGDEADPTVKVKIFNMCVEYNPSLVTALTNTDEAVTIEDMVSSLAQTVANLAVTDAAPPVQPGASSQRTVMIDLLIHESAIGLTPNELTSKAFFVLTDAHFVTKVPADELQVVKADLRHASLFLTDSVEDDEHGLPPNTIKGRPHFANGKTRLANSLSERGYVSILSIMSASVTVQIKEVEGNDSKAIEVDVRNELLLLETCADSTQTLFATLGALAPPTTPSSEPKYLTEPMTIEDMMASFTGDAIEEPAVPIETLFDADSGSTGDLDMPLEYSTLIEDTDGLLAESEMSSSLYGPVSGLLGLEDDMDDGESVLERDNFPETAESLLDEDPFEMTITPEEMPLGDAALMRSLAKQSKSVTSDQLIEVELCEVDDRVLDAIPITLGIIGKRNQFNVPLENGRQDRAAKNKNTILPFQLRLRDFHVIWNLYDGYDWQWTQNGIAHAVDQVEQKAEERRVRRQQALIDREDDESVIGDFLFNSIYIGVPADMEAQDLRRQINRNIDDQISETESVPLSAMTRPTSNSISHPSQRSRPRRRLKLSRSSSHKVAFELRGVSADVVTFPPGVGDMVSSVDLRLRDFEIFDNVPSSTWRKFLTHLNNDPAAREMSKPMFHIEVNTVKTLESHSASELTLHVSVLPLRLHVDQDALDFITRFFEFKDERTVTSTSGGEQPFIQRVEVDTVDLCLDYKPKHVDYIGLRSGRTKEFMNFVTLEGANIRLKHAIVYGLRGFDTLHDTLNNVWVPDVTRNQLPTVLAGLASVRSLVTIGSGVRDVVAIPIREYKKDGRIVRSIQKGAYHFGKTTASELARLGAKVALGTQTVLTTAEEYLTPSRPPSARPSSARGMHSDQGWHDATSDDDEPQRRAVSAYANQPLGVLSGLRSARRYLEHDLLTAKDAFIAVQGEVLESRGPGAAAAAVARHAPTVILRPVIGATRAVGTTLLGVGNQIDRSHVRRADDKYKHR